MILNNHQKLHKVHPKEQKEEIETQEKRHILQRISINFYRIFCRISPNLARKQKSLMSLRSLSCSF